MPKFLLAYHGGAMEPTPEAQAKAMEAWGAWFGKVGPAITDTGNPTGPASTIASNGTVTSGGGANPVSGYSFLEAASLAAAVELTKGNPIFATGGSIEVCEVMPM